ncbi:hypothetical protein [Paracoccus aestuariivivens]|nr:hypothetical protein [Paracoccus aestuariivivens]
MSRKVTDACDAVLHEAANKMIEAGADVGMVIDRLLTFTAGQMVYTTSKADAADAFRQCAKVVESGLFDHVKTGVRLKKH